MPPPKTHTTPAVPMDGGREALIHDVESLARFIAHEHDEVGRAKRRHYETARSIFAALTPSSADAGAGLREALKKAVSGVLYKNQFEEDWRELVDPIVDAVFAISAPPAQAETAGEDHPNRRDVAPLKWNPAAGSLHGHKLGDRVVALGKKTGLGTLEDIDATGGCNMGKVRFDQGGSEWVRFSRFDHLRPALAAHRHAAQAGAGDGITAARFMRAAYEIAGPRPKDRFGVEPAWTADLYEVERRAAAPIGTGNGEASGS